MRILIVLIVCLCSTNLWSQEPTTREMEMIRVINKFRKDPQSAIPVVQQYLEHWESDASEKAAANELIRELKKLKTLDTLSYSPELYELAKAHGGWMKKNDRFAHSKNKQAENLVSGNEDVTFAVIDLLIDDGIPGRGHRKNLLNPAFRKVACFEVFGEVDGIDFNFVQIFE